MSRVFARRVVEVLATQGALAELRPSASAGTSRGLWPWMLGGAALVGLGAAVTTWKVMRSE